MTVLSALALAALQSVGSVSVFGPDEGPIRFVTPTFTIATSGFTAAERPLTLGLQISRSQLFDSFDFELTATGDTARIPLPRPLPEETRLYWRAFARTALGETLFSAVTGPRSVEPWLTLVSPNSPRGSTVETPLPTFIWSSARVSSPPGPWQYDFEVTTASGARVVARVPDLADTTFTMRTALETNTPYRWGVTARLITGDMTRKMSGATFVVIEPGRPVATLLFPTFPNPFPSRSSPTACIWFDLRNTSEIRLEVYDIRANLVRSIVPSRDIAGTLPAGRYGRTSSTDGDGAGCDPQYAWDGTAENGQVVPPGVYLLRLRADGSVFTRKIVFRGR